MQIKAEVVALDLETYDPGLKILGPGWPWAEAGFPVGYALSWREEGELKSIYLPVRHAEGTNMEMAEVRSILGPVLADPRRTVVMANCLYDYGWTLWDGFEWKAQVDDVQIIAPLIDDLRMSYSLNALAKEYLGEEKRDDGMKEMAKEIGISDPMTNMHRMPSSMVAPYATGDTELTLRVYEKLRPMIDELDLGRVHQLERDLVPVLYAMRKRGVRVDTDRATQERSRLIQLEAQLQDELRVLTGRNLEPWAAAPIIEVLREEGVESFPLTPKKKEPSLSAGFLKELAESGTKAGQIAKLIGDLRRWQKTRSTFFESMILEHAVDGRIHCELLAVKQDDGGTVSGRFCVAGDTVLELDTGPVEIENYEPTGNERIKTHKGRWRRVLKRINKGWNPMYRVSFEDGSEVKCTSGHRLLTSAGWRHLSQLSVGSKVLVGEQKVDLQPEERGRGGCRIPFRTETDLAGGCRQARHALPQCRSRGAGSTYSGALQERAGAEVLALKDRRKEPDEGQNRRISPQLYRSPEQGRIQDNDSSAVAREQLYPDLVLRTSETGLRGAGNTEDSRGVARSPHRRESFEQQRGQPGLGDFPGAPKTPQEIAISEIAFVGILPTWDIEVEEDHSYVAHGVIHHNSARSPNLQQVPARDEEIGPLVRGCFLPDKGYQWGSIDYSSQEPRIALHLAALYGKARPIRGVAEMVEAWRADPNLDPYLPTADLCGISRKAAKTIKLGILYGMGGGKLCASLGLPTQMKSWRGREIEIAGPEGEELLEKYHSAAPMDKALSNAVTQTIKKRARAATGPDPRGFIRTVLGRRSTFPRRENGDVWFTHKGLNRAVQGSAADMMKQAMVDCYRAGLLPLLSVHDELCFNVESRAQAEQIAEIMCNAIPLEVPIVADVEIGANWGESMG